MKLCRIDEDHVAFYCPGCETSHVVLVSIKGWNWNNSFESPTITPSILIRSGHYIDNREICWCTYNKEHSSDPAPFHCSRCHSFIIDGKIQFLADCSHPLSGQTVEIPEWDECK